MPTHPVARPRTRVISLPPSEHHEPTQASDLIAFVVLALMLANIVLFMALSS
jgi:hypothetical protein